MLLQQQRHVGGELFAQPLALLQRLLGLLPPQLVLLGQQAGLPLILIGDGQIELLQFQFAEIVALLGRELLQLQHLDPVGEALLLHSGQQQLCLLLAIRFAAEAQSLQLAAGQLQLFAQIIHPQVILLTGALQLVEAVHHPLPLLAQVELAVAAQAYGLAQRLLLEARQRRASSGLIVVQALLEACRLLGVIDKDLLIGFTLLPVTLGLSSKLQRLLVALPQLLVFRGIALGHALQQGFGLGNGIVGAHGWRQQEKGEQQEGEQALQHEARFRSEEVALA